MRIIHMKVCRLQKGMGINMWRTDGLSGEQINNTNSRVAAKQSVPGHINGASVNRQIQALAPGKTLQGEVVSRNGSQVQIKVSDDLILEAKVDRNVNLEVGKTMTFEVRNNGQQLTLSPLFANTASEANALKALEMASLPVNQTTVSMTGLMMEAGLSVDRASLQQMYREINSFPEANISDVVDLHRLGLAVNEENLAQISSYKNLTHQLVDGMHTVLEALPEGMQAMAEEGNIEGAARMFQDILEMIQGLPGDGETAEGILGNDNDLQNAVLQGEQTAESVEQENAGLKGTEQLNADRPDVGGVVGEPAAVQTEEGLLQDVLTDAVKQAAADIDAAARESVLQLVDTGEDTQITSAGQENYRTFSQMAMQAAQNGDTQQYIALTEFAQTLKNGSLVEQAKVLQQLLEHGIQSHNNRLLSTLLSNKASQSILTEGLSKLWTIEPKDVAASGKVEELYTRLDRQLKVLAHDLEQNGQSQSSAFRAVSNMNQNLDFLQQINHAYTYVQLPLRLQQGDTHGDLYVYTNKRNLAAKDGQISALLHLDMEHLGPVDVYVAMQADRVNTRFYVRDDEMLDFLEEHMDLLTERLQKRGYNCEFAMQVRSEGSEPESGIKGLVSEEHAQPIARYAFDVRA